jgi:hypothetical protein
VVLYIVITTLEAEGKLRKGIKRWDVQKESQNKKGKSRRA